MNRQDLELYESPAVIKHIEILQGIITRMAGNSAACKTWCITIIMGMLALFFIDGFPIILGIIPVVLFFALDSFYLGLEGHFRKLHNEFVKKLHKKKLDIIDIFVIKSKRSFRIHAGFVRYGMKSFSTLFFYIPLMILVIAIFFFN